MKIITNMSKIILICIGVIFLTLNRGYSQIQEFVRQWNVNPDTSLNRPQNVSKHAYLFESDQDHFTVHVWVEYVGKDSNEVHKVSIYDTHGVKKSTNYYFTLEDSFEFNKENEYSVTSPFSTVIGLTTDNKSVDLYSFDINPRINKAGFTLIRAYEDNDFYGKVEGVSILGPAPFVWVKADKISNEYYLITLMDEYGDIKKLKYRLHNKSKSKDVLHSPLRFKYLHLNSGTIYLVEKGYTLIKGE